MRLSPLFMMVKIARSLERATGLIGAERPVGLVGRCGEGGRQSLGDIEVTVGGAGSAFELSDFVRYILYSSTWVVGFMRTTHQPGVDGAELPEGEEVCTVISILEHEGGRLEDGSSTSAVVRIELVAVVQGNSVEALALRILIWTLLGCHHF